MYLMRSTVGTRRGDCPRKSPGARFFAGADAGIERSGFVGGLWLGGRIRMTFSRVRSVARAGLGLSVIAAALAGACGNDESNKHPNVGGSAALAGDAGK